jgi:hypothetical protein
MRKVVGLFFILLVLSLSFSSAGWFSDTWGKITGESVSCSRCANSTHATIAKVDYKINYTITSSEVSLPVGGLVLNEDSTKKINVSAMDVDYVNFTGQSTSNKACEFYVIWTNGNYISAGTGVSLGPSISTVKRSSFINNVGVADAIRMFTLKKCSGNVVIYNISLVGRPLFNVNLFSGKLTLSDVSNTSVSFNLSKPVAIKELFFNAEKISRSSSFCSVVVKYIYEDNSSQVFNNLRGLNSLSSESSISSQYKLVKSIEVSSGYRSFFSWGHGSYRDCSNKLRLLKLSASVLTVNATDPDF